MESVKYYQDAGFYFINQYLRNSTTPPNAELDAHIRNLDSLMEYNPSEIVLYRGCDKRYPENQGYTSTTTDLRIAKKFAGTKGVVLCMKIPANTVKMIRANCWNNSEQEYILEKGLKFA